MKSLAIGLSALLVFCGMRVIGLAEEILDVETLPVLRTQRYSEAPYKKVIIFSAPRTGSSLAYNVFRFLFEADSALFCHHYEFNQDLLVLKTHKFSDLDLLVEENVLYVFTIRHPIDASISNFRICTREIPSLKEFAEQLINRHKEYLLFFEKLKAEGQNVVLLKYEDFTGNIDYLFESIEARFSIIIAAEDKDLMRKGYSKENIYACIKAFPDFNEYLPISGFHGKHVIFEKYTPPKEFLRWLNIYAKEVRPLFRKYGYFNN